MKKNTLNNWEKEKKKKQISVTKCYFLNEMMILKLKKIIMLERKEESLF